MSYKNFIRKRHLPQLLCGLLSVFLSMEASAQCNVFFSSCPEKVVIIDCDDDGYEPISWPQPIAATTGGCTNFSMVQTGGPAPGTLVAAPGTYTIKFVAVATDVLTGKSKKVGCTFTVDVIKDTEPPVFTNCPPDITVYAGNGQTANASWTLPTATDNCNGEVIVKSKAACNGEYSIGVHQITYKAVDASGNVSYCTFTVTVLPGFLKPAASEEGIVPLNASITPRGHEVLNGEPDVFLLPNPFRNKLVINTDRAFDSDAEVAVLDLQGRLLMRQNWVAQSQQLILPAESIKPGVVLIKIVSSDGAYNKVLRGVKL